MATSSPQQPSFPTSHTCRHCSNFIIHLFDDPHEAQADAEFLLPPPNSSQERLAQQLFGNDFWAEEHTEYRNYFFQRTAGISFLDASKADLERFANDACLLSQRVIECLREDELPEKYALGVMLMKEHGWSVEMRIVDLEDLRSEMLLAEEDEEPDNIYSVLAEEGERLKSIHISSFGRVQLLTWPEGVLLREFSITTLSTCSLAQYLL